jgi:serine phosphatase RsbU (regulator of sigma subunit)
MKSPAFEAALLKTERLRIIGVIVIVSVFAITGSIRIYLFGSHMNHIGVYGSIAFLMYELLILRAIDRSIKSQSPLSKMFWTQNIVIEMCMPVVGLAFLVSDRIPLDYRPVASSWVLLFFPFLILSTLRLSFLISTLAGFVGAIGYVAAAANNGWHIKSDLLTNPVSHSAVPFFAIMIFASGVIAGIVAGEIRKHVEAALREAETQRQLKQIEHDLTIAKSIQQSLLPKVRPHVEGYEIAGWNRPADATGGDYFDWKQLEDGRLVITLADVTGHGIGPALLASVCRAYARANFNNAEPLPSTLQRINRSFGEDLQPGRFATFVAAVCQPGSNDIELLSAGHAPLFRYSYATDVFEKFPAHDVPLGVLPRLTGGSSQVFSMNVGDTVFLITDGFVEWENAKGEQFGEIEFERAVRATRHLGPEEIIAEIYAAALKFSNGVPQQDDLTVVVIKRTEALREKVAA